MQNKLNLLKDLQEIDQEISAIQVTRKEYQDELLAFEKNAARVQTMHDQLSEEIALLNQDEAQLQQELLKERDNVKRVEARLPEIQTQKEYVAVLKEIDVAKKANKDIEDQLQVKLQAIETLDADRQEKEVELAAMKENSDVRGAELTTLLNDSEAVLSKRTKTRESLATDLPASLLRKYQTLFKRRGGLALALASNGACLGCNMALPPQQFNRLLRATDLQTCPHCNRILYVEQDV